MGADGSGWEADVGVRGWLGWRWDWEQAESSQAVKQSSNQGSNRRDSHSQVKSSMPRVYGSLRGESYRGSRLTRPHAPKQ